MRNAREEQKPFFVQVSYHAVHGPLKPQAPDRYFKRFESSSFDLQNFYAHVYAVDQSVAAIRDAPGSDGENTLLIFCGDNGTPTQVQYLFRPTLHIAATKVHTCSAGFACLCFDS